MKNPNIYNSKFELFSIENENEFKQVLSKCFAYPGIKTEKKIEEQFHFRYFTNYLFSEEKGLNVKTILFEKEYTSASYLGDYVNYYVHCYRPYSKRCQRIHFFRESFDNINDDFINALIGDVSKYHNFWNSYAGYIVVRPLPNGVIGATLVQTYDKRDNRYYTVTRKYPVNLFGKHLEIESLPYQEQDGIVGSCASSALWFAFQKTSELFHSPLLNPSDITILAGLDINNTGKNFPSSRLEVNQICQAINSNNLVSELLNSDEHIINNKWLKAFIYSYLRMGIPVLLGVDIEKEGRHLVTLNGYRFTPDKNKVEAQNKLHEALDNDKNGKIDITKLQLHSDNIIKLYAHDDQTGPFSRMEFTTNGGKFITSWWDSINTNTNLKGDTVCVIVPIDKTIKVTFENILDQSSIIQFALKQHLNLIFTWDIYIIESNKYKSEIKEELIKNMDSYDMNACSILFESLPQYIWVAKGYYANGEGKSQLVFDFIFDAIDVNYKVPYKVNLYSKSMRDNIIALEMQKELSFFFDETDVAERPTLYSVIDEDSALIDYIEDYQNTIQKGGKNLKGSNILTQLEEDIQANSDFNNSAKDIAEKIDNEQ